MFVFQKFDIDKLILVKPNIFEDSRGYFSETYRKNIFFDNGISVDFVQENESYSKYKVLRGLHYQINNCSQGKLVKCIWGKIIDVAVDLRKNSKTFKKWIKVELSQENKYQFYIPEGFAHGFVVLSQFAKVSYKTTNYYSKDHDRGIIWNDPSININWGLDFDPIISDKDANLPQLNDAEINFI